MSDQIDPVFFVLATKPTNQPTNLEQYEAATKLAQEHLATFDTLDYDVFSGAEWTASKRAMPTTLQSIGRMAMPHMASISISLT